MGIFLTKNLHFCGSIIQWAIFNLSKLAGECIKKLFLISGVFQLPRKLPKMRNCNKTGF